MLLYLIRGFTNQGNVVFLKGWSSLFNLCIFTMLENGKWCISNLQDLFLQFVSSCIWMETGIMIENAQK